MCNEDFAVKKKIFRKSMKQRRSVLPDDVINSWSQSICNTIIHWDTYLKSNTILLYYPNGHEVDLRPVMLHGLSAGKTIGLPRVTGPNTMSFFQIRSFNELKHGWMNIMEPVSGCPCLDEQSSFLMLLPGLAFSLPNSSFQSPSAGVGRMGYGGGFYDRWLSHFYEKQKRPDFITGHFSRDQSAIVTCGVAYDIQIVDESLLFLENHDIRLDAVVTEKQLYYNKEDER